MFAGLLDFDWMVVIELLGVLASVFAIFFTSDRVGGRRGGSRPPVDNRQRVADLLRPADAFMPFPPPWSG
jgi:hypothetical protein